MPAYGVVQFRTPFTLELSQADKPNSGTGLFFANGPVDVAAGKAGESLLWNRPRLVLLDSAATVGDMVGPVADSWEMSTSGSGFCVIHQPIAGVGTVVQVGGGSRGVPRHAIVSECLGSGYYLAEFATFTPVVPDADTQASGVCDPCNLITTDCDDPTEPESDRVVPTGTGDYCTVYDLRELPLTVGKHIVIVDIGDRESSGASGDDTVWIVLTANRPLTKLKVEDWDCCDGVVTRIACDFYLIEAVHCEGESTPCPSV